MQFHVFHQSQSYPETRAVSCQHEKPLLDSSHRMDPESNLRQKTKSNGAMSVFSQMTLRETFIKQDSAFNTLTMSIH